MQKPAANTSGCERCVSPRALDRSLVSDDAPLLKEAGALLLYDLARAGFEVRQGAGVSPASCRPRDIESVRQTSTRSPGVAILGCRGHGLTRTSSTTTAAGRRILRFRRDINQILNSSNTSPWVEKRTQNQTTKAATVCCSNTVCVRRPR